MPHVRQQIRDAVKTVLTGLTTTGNNVDVARVYDVDTTRLPHWTVSTPSEQAGDTNRGAKQFRTLTVQAEGRVKATSNYAGVADTIAAEAEVAVAEYDRDDYQTIPIKWIRYKGCTTELDETDQPIVLLTLEWECLYRVELTDPTVAIE